MAMVGEGPGFLPKTALVGSKAVYYPFTIPQQLNDSATLTGKALNGMVNGITASVGQAYVDLKPRGPAKWLLPLFQKTVDATVRSEEIANRNKAVFWDPFSQGVEQVGRSLASPGTYWYLKKAGIDQPTQDQIKGALQTPLFHFPTADEVGGGAPPAEPPAEPGGGAEPSGEPVPEAGAAGAAASDAGAADAAAQAGAGDAAAQAAADAAAQAGAQQAAEGAGEVKAAA